MAAHGVNRKTIWLCCVRVCACAAVVAAASRFNLQSMSKAKAQYQALSILALMYDCKKASSNASNARTDGHNLLFIICYFS